MAGSMQLAEAAACLSSLGSATRLELFRLLVRAGAKGLTVGELKTSLDLPGATLSHHIKELVAQELIRQDRDGRTLHCRANYTAMQQLLEFLTNECCVDEDCC
tara:strand:- start:31883 stop:32191 length:309 start_codon:yes stop_codon:yes gene_type:complete